MKLRLNIARTSFTSRRKGSGISLTQRINKWPYYVQEMHTEEMGKIRNTKAKPIGQSRREKAREERSKLAASKLPEDLLPY